MTMLLFTTLLLVTSLLFHSSTNALSSSTTTTTTTPSSSSSSESPPLTKLAGNWAEAKAALQNPNCCVVSVSGLESHLQVLQKHWVEIDGTYNNNGGVPADLDLRARVNIQNSAYKDCLQIRRSVSQSKLDDDNDENDKEKKDACALALEELSRGVASLAEIDNNDRPKQQQQQTQLDVFVRIVFASNYRGRDPMFHTDKAPLRGYVTLKGVGTEFMTRPCTPFEYVWLRTLGEQGFGAGIGAGIGGGDAIVKDLRQAEELEFIVMKGDYYNHAPTKSTTTNKTTTSSSSSWLFAQAWKRLFACVHRSPPAPTTTGGKRVIVSLDLADGDDDREWYQANMKREWRSGMTQRKSRLVA